MFWALSFGAEVMWLRLYVNKQSNLSTGSSMKSCDVMWWINRKSLITTTLTGGKREKEGFFFFFLKWNLFFSITVTDNMIVLVPAPAARTKGPLTFRSQFITQSHSANASLRGGGGVRSGKDGGGYQWGDLWPLIWHRQTCPFFYSHNQQVSAFVS